MIKVIDVNDRVFFQGKDFDEAKVWGPTQSEPYWQIFLYLEGKEAKAIYATGQITIIEGE